MKFFSFITTVVTGLTLAVGCSSKSGSLDPNANPNGEHSKKVGEGETAYEIPLIDLNAINASDCNDPWTEKKNLEQSIRFAKAACVKKIVQDHKIDLNSPTVDVFGHIGELPLVLALSGNSVFFGKDNPALVPALLISLGADPNAKTGSGQTMLDLALNLDNGKYRSVAHYMIELQAINVDQASRSGTPLERGIELKEKPLISHLIHRGAKVNLSTHGVSPLYLAIEQGLEVSSIQLVDAGADLSVINSGKETPLHRAILRGMILAAKKMIAGKAPLDFQDSNGATPLHIAVRSDKADFVVALIQGGAGLEFKDASGKTPLFVAVESSQSPAVESLLNANASASTVDVLGRGLVQVARQSELALRLLKANAPADQKSQAGDTPLSVHTVLNNLEVIKALVGRGADIRWKDQSARTLLHLASNANALQVAEYLINLGLSSEDEDNRGSTALFEISSVEMLSMLMNAKANINHLNKDKNPAVLQYVNAMNLALVTAFFDRKADMDWGHDSGTSYLIELFKSATPFSNAQINSLLIKMAHFLLQRGVDSARKTKSGHAAIHYLYFNPFIVQSSVLVDLCKVFRDDGVNVLQVTADGKTLKTLLSDELDEQTKEYKALMAIATAQNNQKKIEELKNKYDPVLARLKTAIVLL